VAARHSKDGPQACRLLALAAIYDGAMRTEAAKIGGVGLQVVRDWVLRFNAHGPDGLIDRKAPGQAPRLNDEHRAALAAILESGPIPAVPGVVRWRIIDLCQWMDFRGTFASPSPSRRLVGCCARWVIASSRLALAIMLRPPAQSRDFKKRMARPSASGFVEIGC
jgi:transposase